MAFRNPIVLINGQLQELPGYDRLRNSGNIIRQQATPVNPVDGDLWFDTGNNLLKIWDALVSPQSVAAAVAVLLQQCHQRLPLLPAMEAFGMTLPLGS